MLHEKHTIEKSLNKFAVLAHDRFDIKIIIITSSKEISSGSQTTEDVVRLTLTKEPLMNHAERIRIIRDPDMNGNMATQLNCALQTIKEEGKEKSFYMIYNIDSIVTKSTLSALLAIISNSNGEVVTQQPCAYVKALNNASHGFVKALSLFQTWYCLSHEHKLIQKYQTGTMKPGMIPRLGIITGHGSGMSVSTHNKYGGYPSELITEDLTFAFILSANQVPIYLLPAMEVADVPLNLLAFIRQRSVWIWNYMSYFWCFNQMRKAGKKPVYLTLLLIQGLGAGIYWLMASIFVFGPIIIGILQQSLAILLLASFCILFFSILPHYVLFKSLPPVLKSQGMSSFAREIKNISFGPIIPYLLVVVATDSVGPWIGVLKAVSFFLTGSQPKKHQTAHV